MTETPVWPGKTWIIGVANVMVAKAGALAALRMKIKRLGLRRLFMVFTF